MGSVVVHSLWLGLGIARRFWSVWDGLHCLYEISDFLGVWHLDGNARILMLFPCPFLLLELVLHCLRCPREVG